MMIPGVAVAMAGQDWLVPPLTLGQLRRLMPKVRELTEIGASMGELQIAVLVEIVTAALQRNYPDVSQNQVEDLLDLGNASAVLNAVLTGSGLKPSGTPLGEAPALGTIPGADPAIPAPLPVMVEASPRAGSKSTDFSPPPAATPIPKSMR